MIVDPAGAGRDTLVEVRVADGIGVLYRITQALVGLDLRVHRAFVSTLGHEVVDTFYVTGVDGEPVHGPGRPRPHRTGGGGRGGRRSPVAAKVSGLRQRPEPLS